MEKINHQATTVLESCGIDKTHFEAKLKDWANTIKPTDSKSMVVESLENTFTPRELAVLVQKSIEELTEVHKYLPKQ